MVCRPPRQHTKRMSSSTTEAAGAPVASHSVCRSRAAAKNSPAPVLLCLRRVSIFVTFEPESKPVHIALLRGQPVERLLKDVLAVWNINHIDWHLLASKRGIDVPLHQDGTRTDGLDAKWSR